MNCRLSSMEFHLGRGQAEVEGGGVANTAGAVTLDTCIPSRVGGRTPALIQTTSGQLGEAETGRSTGSPAGPWCPVGPAAYPAS